MNWQLIKQSLSIQLMVQHEKDQVLKRPLFEHELKAIIKQVYEKVKVNKVF